MLKPPGVHGTNECSQPASKSSWGSQDFGDVSMVLKNGPFSPVHQATMSWWIQSLQVMGLFLNDRVYITPKNNTF